MSFSDFQWCLVVCCAVKDILSLYYRSNCKELELEFKSAYRQRRKQNQANRITLCYRLLPACYSILFPFSLQLFSLLPRYEFLPLSLHLHLLLSSLSLAVSLLLGPGDILHLHHITQSEMMRARHTCQSRYSAAPASR